MVSVLEVEKTPIQTDPFEEYRLNPTLVLRNWLVESNLGLARKAASEVYSYSFEPYEDLRQIADMVLIDCVEKFDPSKGYRFSTFALPKLRGRLLNYLRDKGHIIRIPRKYYDTVQKAKRAERSIFKSENRVPSPREIATYAKINFELYLASRYAFFACRFFYPASACIDYPSDFVADNDLDISLDVNGLEEVERLAVTKFFDTKLSFEQVADEMTVSQPELKKVLRSAMKKTKICYSA